MVEGRNQSVLSDAWAKSAQILEFPERMPSGWEITNAAKTKLREQLSRDCDGFRVVVSMELSRENPEVGVLAGMGGRTRRRPRQSGRRNYRGNSANIQRREKWREFPSRNGIFRCDSRGFREPIKCNEWDESIKL